MERINSFKDILAWRKSHELVLMVYELTKKFPRFEEFSLANQIRRAVVSIPSNIAEGFKRRTIKDSANFYNIAEGSLEEVKYQLLLSKDLEYISVEQFEIANNLAEETGRTLYGWRNCQR